MSTGRSGRDRAARSGAAAVLVGAAVQIAPAATWLPPVRHRLAPGLSGLGDRAHLALTFDDGPDAEGTPAVLAALYDLGWRATFFLLGEQVRARPGLAAEVAATGHEIALHGFAHRYLPARSPWATYDDLARGVQTVAEATGVRPRWFRPPYGVLTSACLWAAARLRLRPVLWSAWGRDWRHDATAASVVAELTRGVLAGGTALLHDSDATAAPGSWRTTVGALPLLADEVRRRGLAVGPLGEHR